MRSRNKSVRFAQDVLDDAEERAKEIGYSSFNAYVNAVVWYDLMIRGDHSITLPISRLSLEDQDRILADVRKAYQAGGNVRGVYLNHAIDRAVKKLGGEPTGEQVAREMLKAAKEKPAEQNGSEE